MRLFVAIELPEDVKNALVALKTNLDGARWTNREQFHLTLRFIGEGITQTQLSAIDAALTEIHAEWFAMQLQDVGRFPQNAQRPPRVIWTGVSQNPALTILYHAIDTVLTSSGLALNDHDFSPHITLARVDTRSLEAVNRFVQQHSTFASRQFPVESFILFSSELSPAGAVYYPKATYRLGG